MMPMPGQAESDAAIQARLQKPGAGVPWYQLLFLRLYIKPFVAAKGGWEKDKADFARINAKILKICDGLNNVELGRRILVPKQPGLEDSSRYWSAAMTLEHMVIVGHGIRDITISLSKGIVPGGAADTAAVKPQGAMTPAESLDAFRNFAARTMEEIDTALGDTDSTAVFKHPWFGDFNTRQWHWMLAMHSIVHLRQLREIAKRAKAA